MILLIRVRAENSVALNFPRHRRRRSHGERQVMPGVPLIFPLS